MLFKIKCPACAEEGSFSLVDQGYTGPYRCWKCKALFEVTLAHGRLESARPMSAAELESLENAKKAKYR
ncbi:MAG: hypothetical protein HYX96_04215 [Chloroflexi bacterium]|nr:hypothetical protein [Chloroflexota bacterium]